MLEDPRKQRLVIEKPFGKDLSSAQMLNRVVYQTCAEEQIYRIRVCPRSLRNPGADPFWRWRSDNSAGI
jgi:hypothetical protein